MIFLTMRIKYVFFLFCFVLLFCFVWGVCVCVCVCRRVGCVYRIPKQLVSTTIRIIFSNRMLTFLSCLRFMQKLLIQLSLLISVVPVADQSNMSFLYHGILGKFVCLSFCVQYAFYHSFSAFSTVFISNIDLFG